MNKKLQALYGLKFNPFTEVPTQSLWVSPMIESFCWRVEQQIGEGGFSLATGDPGTGKSVALRILAERLGNLRDVTVGILTRPQASLADFYRELGHLFKTPLSPHNRWASASVLREKWHKHIEASLYRPVLLIDEAQEMNSAVLSELRLLCSADLDSRSILAIILAGDCRLENRLQTPELLPVASRIRSRLRAQVLSPQALGQCLTHLLRKAGNSRLMSSALIHTLCEHAAGNLRLLMNLADELLAEGVRQEVDQLDEKLFFEVFAMDHKPAPKKRSRS